MKVNINTIRILFILVNLGIIAFIVIGYVEGMGLYPGDKGPDAGSGSSNDGLKSPAGFVYAEADYVQPESRETRLRSAASWLIPARPVPPTPIDSVTTGAAEEDPVEPETADGEPIEGGPLEKDNWHYVHAFIFPENPLKSWIRLEKKDENKSTPSTSSRYSRGRTSSSRSSSLRRSSSSSKIRSENTITLNIEERWYVDEEKGLNFKIDSVSHNELVYWTDNPKRMYKLVKVSESFYLEESREEQRLEPKKAEEGEDGEKEKEEKKFFKRYPRGTRPLKKMEEDYQHMLRGEETTGFLKPTKLGEGEATKGPTRIQYPASRTTSRSSSSSSYRKPGTSTSKTVAPRKPLSEAEQKLQLGKALKDAEKSGKMTDSDRKQLDKIKEMLKGKGKGGKK